MLDDGTRSIEHLVPAALGGWLTSDDVCIDCNSMFGHDVDMVVDDHLLLALRNSAGLSVAQVLERELDDPYLRKPVRGRLTDDGIVEPLSPVYRDGDRIIVRTSSEHEGRHIVRTLQERAARDGRTFTIHQIEPNAEPGAEVWVRTRIHMQDAGDLNQLLKREAAKIAIEYVARVAGVEIALVAELDPAREFARAGGAIDGAIVMYTGPRPHVLLPRTNELLRLGGNELPDPRVLDHEMDDLLARTSGDSPPDLSAFPQWPGFEHRLELIKDATGPRFQLTVFSALVVSIPLPGSLAGLLPWGCIDTNEVRGGEITSAHPWGGPVPLLRGSVQRPSPEG